MEKKQKGQILVTKKSQTKAQIERKLKLEYTKECMFYGFKYPAAKNFFISKGINPPSRALYKQLKEKVRKDRNQSTWYSKDALLLMEEDHQKSIARAMLMEERLIADDDLLEEVQMDEDMKESQKQMFINIKSQARSTIYKNWRELQDIKSKMFNATPLVTEIVEVHRRQMLEEENLK